MALKSSTKHGHQGNASSWFGWLYMIAAGRQNAGSATVFKTTMLAFFAIKSQSPSTIYCCSVPFLVKFGLEF